VVLARGGLLDALELAVGGGLLTVLDLGVLDLGGTFEESDRDVASTIVASGSILLIRA
jgi:hypothetical protein